MDKNIRHIQNEYKSKQGVNTDIYLNLDINENKRLLPPDELNRLLDIAVQFNKERQSSTFYRIIGKINPLISNVLFNTVGANDCWGMFDTAPFKKPTVDQDKEVLTFGDAIKKHLKEVDGWYGYYNPDPARSASCSFTDMEPKRQRFSFMEDASNIPNQRVKNWELTITYPYAADNTHYLINEGILLVDKKEVTVGGKKMTAIATPIKHNLFRSSTVRIINSNFDGDYEIKRLGLDDGSLKEYYFCIDIQTNAVTLDNDSRMQKMYKGLPCKYYFRKFRKVKTRSSNVIETDDYEIYKLAFSENLFSDSIIQFVFNEDINIEGLVDNLNRPLSEIFLTLIKTDSNNIFGNISSGIEAPVISELNNYNSNPYFKDLPIIQKIHNATISPTSTIPASYTPLESDVKITNNDFYGDVVEYNIYTLAETVLADVHHRFNTVNRETKISTLFPDVRPEGYYYKAHHSMKIRTYSSYIEEGDSKTYGIPDYAYNLGDGRIIWRDLLDIGRTDIIPDAVNYPFLNGCHYLYQNYTFEIKRQDPFDYWDLYYAQFPSDPIGNLMSNKYKINNSENVC